MDDVFGVIVLAVGNEDLRSEQPIVIVLGNRLGDHRAQIRAGLGLGKVHRARPLPGNHFCKVTLLQLVAAAEVNCFDCAMRQHLAQRKAHVGGVPHLLHRSSHHRWQSLPAIVRIAGQHGPAAVDELPVGLLEAVRGRHGMVFEFAALGIALFVERGQNLARELGCFFQYGVDQIRCDFFAAGQPGHLVKTDQFTQYELHIAEGSKVGAHDFSNSLTSSGTA